MKSPIAALLLALTAVACSATGSAPSALALSTVAVGEVVDSTGLAAEGVVRTEAGWSALWTRLAGADVERPPVDFAREMVVYAARPGGAVSIAGVVSDGGFLRVELREAGGQGFHAVRLARSEAPVQFAPAD